MKHKENQTPYMELQGIDRFFGITKALQKVDLQIYSGEVILSLIHIYEPTRH